MLGPATNEPSSEEGAGCCGGRSECDLVRPNAAGGAPRVDAELVDARGVETSAVEVDQAVPSESWREGLMADVEVSS